MTLLHPRFRSLVAAFGLTAVLAAGGCGPPVSGRVYVRVGPPPIVVERPIASPGPGFVWVPGFYRWSGRDYVWVRGSWQQPPRARQRWVPGRWERDRHGWFWVEGHWR